MSPLYLGAARLDEHAAILRARATRVGLGAATTRWYSPAGRTYFARLDDATHQLTACATQLDALAELVRSHAARLLNLP